MRAQALALSFVALFAIALLPGASAATAPCVRVGIVVDACVGTPTTVDSTLVCVLDSAFGWLQPPVPCHATLP